MYFATISPLPAFLSAISSSHKPYSSIVPSRDHRPLFLDALAWLFKHDLVVMLHIRVKIVVNEEIKRTVREARRIELVEAKQRKKLRKERRSSLSLEGLLLSNGFDRTRRSGSGELKRRESASPDLLHARRRSSSHIDMDLNGDDREIDVVEWGEADDDLTPSLIPDPGRATPLERRWLQAMCVGISGPVVQLFEKWVSILFWSL
jgi:hypothetical protein